MYRRTYRQVKICARGVKELTSVSTAKSVVCCAPTPRTSQELQLRIQEEISRIPVDVLRRALCSVQDRLAECEQRNGGHLEDVTFRVE